MIHDVALEHGLHEAVAHNPRDHLLHIDLGQGRDFNALQAGRGPGQPGGVERRPGGEDGEAGHGGRSGNDHRGTGPGKGVDGDAQGSEDRRGQGDPPRLDGPTVAAVFKLNQRLLDGLARPGRRVAEKPLLNSLLEACFHGGGGAEVHLRNPCSKG